MSETKISRLSSWWKEWRLTILAVILISIMIAITIHTISTKVPATYVKNLFVDIDGDGDLDLVVSAEVVLNERPFGEVLRELPQEDFE